MTIFSAHGTSTPDRTSADRSANRLTPRPTSRLAQTSFFVLQFSGRTSTSSFAFLLRRARGRHACRFLLRGSTRHLRGEVRRIQYAITRLMSTQSYFRPNLSKVLLGLHDVQVSPPGTPGRPRPSEPGYSVPPGTSTRPPHGPLIRRARPPHVKQFQLGRFQTRNRLTWDMLQPHRIPISLTSHGGSIVIRNKQGEPRSP